MGGGATVASLLNNVLETKALPLSQEEKLKAAEYHVKKLFGRQKSVHNLLGGGNAADMLLWRNKKTSGGVLASATAIWVLLLWLNHNFISLFCFSLVFGLLAQFLWSITSQSLYSSSPKVPRVFLPDKLFVDIAKTVAIEVNRALNFLQDVACGGNIKHFLAVIGSLSAAAIIGSFFNFLTVVYIGFVGTQTLPVLYEKYEDQIDNLLYNITDHLQQQFQGNKHD